MKGQNIILQANISQNGSEGNLKCQQVDRFTHTESEPQWNLGGWR